MRHPPPVGRRVYNSGGRHIALYNENNPRGTFYMHPNALGSDSNWTDSHGNTTGEEIYDPWGHKLVSGGYVDRFAGMSHRDQTGFDVTPNRDYSSMVDRWMTPDPAGGHTEDPQTLNKYAYVRNNPLTLTDPTGLDFYLSCQKQSDTCQKDAAENLVQGTTTNGQFTATIVTSASLLDPTSGNTGTVDQSGVQITTKGQTSEGIFINGTPAADLSGSGPLEGFLFHVNGSDERTGNLDFGTYTFTGSRNQSDLVNLLTERGAFSYPFENQVGNPFHSGELNFRFSSGAHPELFDYGSSPHLLVSKDPRATVPVGPGYTGGFHVDSRTGSVSHGECAFLHVGCQ